MTSTTPMYRAPLRACNLNKSLNKADLEPELGDLHLLYLLLYQDPRPSISTPKIPYVPHIIQPKTVILHTNVTVYSCPGLPQHKISLAEVRHHTHTHHDSPMGTPREPWHMVLP